MTILVDAHVLRISICPDNKIHGANMGPTWVLSAPDGHHVGPMNLAIRVVTLSAEFSMPRFIPEYIILVHAKLNAFL